jgi:hypothetical protein
MRVHLMAALVAAAEVPASLAAQTGSVAGVVLTTDSTPIAQARLRISGTPLYAAAARDGSFLLADVPRGRQELDVRMLGYKPLLVSMEVRAGDTVRVRITLVALALELEPVAVTSEGSLALRDFEERRAHGPGAFFTREEIARMQPRQLTDVLRRVPGIQLRPVSGVYGDNILVTSRGGRCPMMFYVNGSPFPLPADIPINHFIAVEEVVAVEVYSPSEMPPQFNSTMYNARCGLVGIWTRSGK